MTSIFFNLECATGITAKGKQLISLATMAFEAFLGDNVAFLDMNDCLIFLKNIIKEGSDRKLNDKDILDSNVTVNEVIFRLRDNFDEECTDYDESVLYRILRNCTKEDLNRIYYKNNLFAFMRNSKIKKLYREIATSVKVYINPDEYATPEHLKKKLEKLWEYLGEYVFYRHEYTDRVFRVKNKMRRVALVIDTDSNMVYLDPFIQFVSKEVLKESDFEEICSGEDEDNLRHVIIYTMCYILSKMIRSVLRMYLTHCNVPKEKIDILDMKNEYLFKRMMVTANKKNYAAEMEFKEGIPMNGKVDVKGLAINKSSANRNASKVFKEILEKKIIKVKGAPNIIEILEDVDSFERTVRESLQKGENTYLKPVSVNAVESYADPLLNSGFRGAMYWNAIYPDQEINFPDSFFLIKTTLTRPRDLEKVTDERIKKIIQETIFDNPEKRISSKGCYVLALPRDVEIPEWVRPFINENQIVDDTMRSFLPIMAAIGMEPIYTGAGEEKISSYIECSTYNRGDSIVCTYKKYKNDVLISSKDALTEVTGLLVNKST